MRLILSTTDHRNTDISDEQGHIYYSISTPLFAFHSVTEITKYHRDDAEGVPETMGVIEWHRLKETRIRFGGMDMPASAMLAKRHVWNTGRYFVGPDGRSYKWKQEATHCWMRLAESNVPLVRFHQINFGILSQSHPAYLDVSDEVLLMLDHIILTFVYVEQLRVESKYAAQVPPPVLIA